jgi:hypothetical protein
VTGFGDDGVDRRDVDDRRVRAEQVLAEVVEAAVHLAEVHLDLAEPRRRVLMVGLVTG